MAEVSAPEDREVSLDVDRLMDRITELSRLTRESLEEDVDCAAPQASDTPGSPSSFAERSRNVAKHSPSLGSSRRSSKTSSKGYADSVLAIARLEAVIQEVKGRGSIRRSSIRRGSVEESVSLGSQSELSGEEFSQDDFVVDDVLDHFRQRLSKLETETRVLCKVFMESESRIKTEVLAKVGKVIESKLSAKCSALESKSYALECKCDVMKNLCDNLESQAQERLGALQSLYASISREAMSGKAKRLAPSEVPTKDRLSSSILDERSQLADLKSHVLTDIEGKMVVLRHEIASMEDRIKMDVCEHLRAESQARVASQQELMEAIEEETKARLCDSLDVWRTISASQSEPPSRVSAQKLRIPPGSMMVPIR